MRKFLYYLSQSMLIVAGLAFVIDFGLALAGITPYPYWLLLLGNEHLGFSLGFIVYAFAAYS